MAQATVRTTAMGRINISVKTNDGEKFLSLSSAEARALNAGLTRHFQVEPQAEVEG
jgi:hypothetical protein